MAKLSDATWTVQVTGLDELKNLVERLELAVDRARKLNPPPPPFGIYRIGDYPPFAPVWSGPGGVGVNPYE